MAAPLGRASVYARMTSTNTGNSLLMDAAQYPFAQKPLFMMRQNGMDGSNHTYSMTLETSGAMSIRNRKADGVCSPGFFFFLEE